MSQRKSRIKKSRATAGFSIIEVMVALSILAIGLLGVAALIGSLISVGGQTRYASTANILASEKLDDLNKWPCNDGDSNVITCDDNLSTGGSLTGPSVCATGDTHCDQVTVSEAGGADYETQTTYDAEGVAQVATIVHTNTGCIDTPTNCGVPAPTASGSTYTRRWLITADPTLTASDGTTATATGSRRITVVVTMNNTPANAPVTFQMSMVRP
jgi:type IV pilus modification protein PilV